MRSPVLEQIEGMIRLLSREEQIWLIERLAHDLRESEVRSRSAPYHCKSGVSVILTGTAEMSYTRLT